MSLPEFHFCPACGKPGIQAASPKHWRCGACDYVLYWNPAAAAAAVLESPSGILLTVRRHDPGRGMFGLPGGFIDAGESAEQGLAREIREELGITPPPLEYFGSYPNQYLYRGVTYETLDLFFRGYCAIPPELRPNEELDDVRWVLRSAIELPRLAFSSMRLAVADFLRLPPRPAHPAPDRT